MKRFKILSSVGDYLQSTVYQAENLETNEIVALKVMKKKFYTWEECMLLPEFKVNRTLSHPHIVKLKEIVRLKKDELVLVYEYVEDSLLKMHQIMKDTKRNIPEDQIRIIIYQIAYALEYLHKKGFFHRDITLESIFICKDNLIKIGNLDSACEINSVGPLTDYISTRWYRSPEQLLKSTNYTYKVDIFALGCLLAQLYLTNPLFSSSTDVDQLHKMCQILGTPSTKDWPQISNITRKFQLPNCPASDFKKIFPQASNEAIDLMKKLLVFNPDRRWNCSEILRHQFFSGIHKELNLTKELTDQTKKKKFDDDE